MHYGYEPYQKRLIPPCYNKYRHMYGPASAVIEIRQTSNIPIMITAKAKNVTEKVTALRLRECLEYAEHNDMTVVKTYIDRNLSAKTDNRPQFQNMVKESASGKFNVVLVWKLDRFARNRYDSTHYKAILRQNGVRIVSAKEAISDGPEGIILESMLEGYAEYYSAALSQKVTRGMTENALKARYNGVPAIRTPPIFIVEFEIGINKIIIIELNIFNDKTIRKSSQSYK